MFQSHQEWNLHKNGKEILINPTKKWEAQQMGIIINSTKQTHGYRENENAMIKYMRKEQNDQLTIYTKYIW